jgi:hypothetical protein
MNERELVMIRIQKRDEYLLKKIGEYGILNNRTIDKIYGGALQYPVRRRKKLADEKYIVKNNKYCSLGANGRRYLEEELGIENIREVASNKYIRTRIGKVAEILMALEKMYYTYPSWKLKDRDVVSERKDKYYGKIVSRISGKSYFIYNLGKIDSTKYVSRAISLKKRYIQEVRQEIMNKAANGKIERVILLAEDKTVMKLYNESLMSLNVKEQLIIPWQEAGFNLIRKIGSENIEEKVVRYLYKDYDDPDWAYADYTTSDGQVVVLVANDGEKIVKVKQSKIINRYNRTNKFKLVVVCLESQYVKFEKEFKEFSNVRIRTVPDGIL